jgi:peroxiredoxin
MKNRTRTVLLGLFALSAATVPSRAQNQAASSTPSPALLAVGATAPAASLLINGRPAPLKGVLAGNRNLVIFYPAACTSCDAELQTIDKGLIQALARMAIAVFAISPDLPAVQAATAQRLSLPFAVFSDPQGAAAAAFHVAGSAAFLIDNDGTVRAVFNANQQPLSGSEMIAAARALKHSSSAPR